MKIVIDISDIEKEPFIRKLAEENTQMLALAYAYVRNLSAYGLDVTEEWDTVVKQASALSRARELGYIDAMKALCNENSD